jgi:uncharacterized C2H2 Zn-finger protein
MSGEVLRAEKDYSKEVDKAIPEAESTAKVRSSGSTTNLY